MRYWWFFSIASKQHFIGCCYLFVESAEIGLKLIEEWGWGTEGCCVLVTGPFTNEHQQMKQVPEDKRTRLLSKAEMEAMHGGVMEIRATEGPRQDPRRN